MKIKKSKLKHTKTSLKLIFTDKIMETSSKSWIRNSLMRYYRMKRGSQEYNGDIQS